MSSEEDVAVKKKTKHSKLCMDSDDQLRAEQSQEERRKRKQEKMLRKREKELQRERRHKEKEERERQREQELEREEEEEQEQLDYDILLQQDSNSHTSYSRVRQKIKEYYPGKKDYWEEKPLEKKPKKEPKPKKVKDQDSEGERQDESPVSKPKATQSKAPAQKADPKDQLVYEFAKRWWYAYPNEWPPKDFDYSAQLEKDGYRLVSTESFRKEPEVQNGLTKVHELEGYTGIFKSTHKLIDARPKDSCPSIQNFRKLSSSQLTELTRKAIENQIESLQKVQFKQQGEDDLLKELNELLHKYSH